MAIERILVISDTHRDPSLLWLVMKVEKKVDRVIHLGDLEEKDDTVKKITQAPLEAVRGNCDYDYDWPSDTITTIGKHMVFLTHGHRYGVNYSTDSLVDMAKGSGCDIAMYGHTHVPEYTRFMDGFVLINPGSLSNPRQYDKYRGRGSYMIIEHDTLTGKLSFNQRYLKK